MIILFETFVTLLISCICIIVFQSFECFFHEKCHFFINKKKTIFLKKLLLYF